MSMQVLYVFRMLECWETDIFPAVTSGCSLVAALCHAMATIYPKATIFCSVSALLCSLVTVCCHYLITGSGNVTFVTSLLVTISTIFTLIYTFKQNNVKSQEYQETLLQLQSQETRLQSQLQSQSQSRLRQHSNDANASQNQQ